MEEVWKDISGYEGLYMISNLGRVKSMHKHTNRKSEFMTPGVHSHGYIEVHLSKNRVRTKYFIHRLVATHFIDAIDGKTEVNHIDNDKTNNCVTNLEWCTRRENINHAIKYGDFNSSMTQEDSDMIRHLHGCFSMYELAAIYDVAVSRISDIINNKCWKGDYSW
jgi:hypothetical protein